MTLAGIDKGLLMRLSDLTKSSIASIRDKSQDGLTAAYLPSLTLMDFLYRIVYYTEFVEVAEETVRCVRNKSEKV